MCDYMIIGTFTELIEYLKLFVEVCFRPRWPILEDLHCEKGIPVLEGA